jgi:hypothetical protein
MIANCGRLLLRFHVTIAAIAILAGCNRSSFELAPVHGTVTVDDQPLFQGKVRFAPVGKGDGDHPGRPALGSIQSDGTYRLTTYKGNDGAVIGEHWVMIANVEEELPDGVPEFSRVTMPQRVTVVEGKDNRIDIKLTSDAIRELREDDT